MAYRFTSAISNNYLQPAGQWLDGFQSFIDADFFNAPSAHTILEEYPFASGSYVNVDVRINRAVKTYLSDKIGDDFKTLIFRDLQHATSMGVKYSFDGNFWIVVNSEIIKNFAASCTIRRCNNQLRWMDNNGIIYEEPVCLEYNISRPRDEISTSTPVTPAGYIEAYCQLNSKTKKIKGNQRFIFGPPENRVGFRVFGDGIRNFLNQETLNDSSGTLLKLSLGGYQINEENDNLTLGIADYYKILQTSQQISLGGT